MTIGWIIDYTWIALPAFFIIRMLIPIADKGMKQKPSETEIETFKEYRVHNVTLATFIIASILLILGFNFNDIGKYVNALFYLSVGMFFFIFASYLLVIRPNRWIPYVGRTLEFTGLIAVAIGFLFLISTVIHQNLLIFSYLLFFIGILAIASFDLAINIHVRYRQK